MMKSWSAFPLLLLLVSIVADAWERWEPFPICLSCIPQALLDAPGIGFELSDSYGTIAVAFDNGTVANVAKVPGSQDYNSFMRRMSGLEAEEIPTHPSMFYNLQTLFTDSVSRILDLRAQTVPTTDIDILSSFLYQLRITAEQYLNTTVDLAVATHPDLPFLEATTLSSAFDLAGMSHLRSYKMMTRLDSLPLPIAGFAALGYGICEHWTKSRVCEKIEDPRLPSRQILRISFTNEALTISNTDVQVPYPMEEVRESVRFDLGFSRLWKDPDNDDAYWRSLREAIENGPASVRKPNLLLLFGEAASDPRFQKTVETALLNVELGDLYKEWKAADQDPLYLAARGAARYAKVWQGSEWNCLEERSCDDSTDCEGSRPKDDGPGSTLRGMYEKRAQYNESCRIGECPGQRDAWKNSWPLKDNVM